MLACRPHAEATDDSGSGGSEIVCWLTAPEIVALGGAEKLAAYIKWAEARCFVPTPHNVDIFIGGPPCQGVGWRA